MFDPGCGDGPLPNDPAATLNRLVDLAPGAQILVELAQIDVEALGTDCAVTYAQVVDRIIGWCQGLQDQALVVAAGAKPRIESFRAGGTSVVIEDLVTEEIASALRWSSGFASQRLAQARLMAGPLAATRRAIMTGHISPAHARVICSASERLPSLHDDSPQGSEEFTAQCAELQSAVLPAASRGTVAQLRRCVERAVLRIDARARRRVARSGLGVNVIDEGSGISTLVARMRSVHAHACMAAVDERASSPCLEVPSDALVGERQALALATLLLPAEVGNDGGVDRQGSGEPVSPDSGIVDGKAACLHPHDGRHGEFNLRPHDRLHDRPHLRPHLRTHLDVTVSLETLLCLSDEPAEFRSRRGVGGALDSWALRELLRQSDHLTLRRLVTDPLTGHLLDRGRQSYRVSESLRAFLLTRDPTCRFPGCSRRTGRREIDHAFAWDAGGATDRGNLGVLCKRHHQAKTFGGWRIELSGVDGGCTWHSPQGRQYQRPAASVVSSVVSIVVSSVVSGAAPVPQRPPP